ncbi:MAG: hypothetical protein M8354_11240 [Halalkalicoccus sp.]|nr:hypothetical protein [Halalkalicoccus sp.]
MTTHIKLHGSKSDRFERIKSELSQWLGYEPSNPEVLGLLMGNYEIDLVAVESDEMDDPDG